MKFQNKNRLCFLAIAIIACSSSVLHAEDLTLEQLLLRIEQLEALVKAKIENDSPPKQSSKLLVEVTGDDAPVASSLVVFGAFRGSANNISDQAETTGDSGFQDGLSFRNNSSVLGIRGETSQGDYKAYFKYLIRSHNDAVFDSGSLQSLYFYAGVASPFGSVQAGTQNSPYKAPALEIDPFYDTSSAIRSGLFNNGDSGPIKNGDSGFDGSNVGMSLLSMGFTRNIIAYKSPTFFGFDVDASVMIDDTNADKHDYNLGFTYKNGPFRGGLQHLFLEQSQATAFSDGEGDATRIWGAFEQTLWSVAASYEAVSVDVGEDQDHTFLTGSYHVNNRLKLAASWGQSDTPGLPDAYRDGNGYSLGAFFKALPNFQVWSIYHNLDRNNGLDRSLVSLGAEYKFAWKHMQH